MPQRHSSPPIPLQPNTIEIFQCGHSIYHDHGKTTPSSPPSPDQNKHRDERRGRSTSRRHHSDEQSRQQRRRARTRGRKAAEHASIARSICALLTLSSSSSSSRRKTGDTVTPRQRAGGVESDGSSVSYLELGSGSDGEEGMRRAASSSPLSSLASDDGLSDCSEMFVPGSAGAAGGGDGGRERRSFLARVERELIPAPLAVGGAAMGERGTLSFFVKMIERREEEGMKAGGRRGSGVEALLKDLGWLSTVFGEETAGCEREGALEGGVEGGFASLSASASSSSPSSGTISTAGEGDAARLPVVFSMGNCPRRECQDGEGGLDASLGGAWEYDEFDTKDLEGLWEHVRWLERGAETAAGQVRERFSAPNGQSQWDGSSLNTETRRENGGLEGGRAVECSRQADALQISSGRRRGPERLHSSFRHFRRGRRARSDAAALIGLYVRHRRGSEVHEGNLGEVTVARWLLRSAARLSYLSTYIPERVDAHHALPLLEMARMWLEQAKMLVATRAPKGWFDACLWHLVEACERVKMR